MLIVETPESFQSKPAYVTKLFLAGTIENGVAELWQQKVIDAFKGYFMHIYNPRRHAWDAELEQSYTCETFNDQVVWEQKYLEEATHVIMNFCSNTLSPISLLELGQLSQMDKSKRVVVVCPKDFWRAGNVEMVCIIYKLPLYRTLDEGIAHLKTLIKEKH